MEEHILDHPGVACKLMIVMQRGVAAPLEFQIPK